MRAVLKQAPHSAASTLCRLLSFVPHHSNGRECSCSRGGLPHTYKLTPLCGTSQLSGKGKCSAAAGGGTKRKSLQNAAPDQQFCQHKNLYLYLCLKVSSVGWSDSKDSGRTTRVKTSEGQELQVSILGKQAKKDLGDRLSLRPLTFI